LRRGQLVGWLLIVGGAHTYINKTLLTMEIHLEEEGASIVAISA